MLEFYSVKNLVFEDRGSEEQNKRGKIFLVVIGSVVIGATTYFIANIIFPGLGLIASLPAMVFFIILFSFKKIPDSLLVPTFKIFEDGIWIEGQKQFFGWNRIDRIELLKGSVLSVRTLPMIALIMGENVVATNTNLNNAQLIEVQNVLEKFGIKVVIK